LKTERGEQMAQRFWGIYQSLQQPKQFPMQSEELGEFIDHIKFEIKRKFKLYGSSELEKDIHLWENLIHESMAEICDSLVNYIPGEDTTFKNWVDGLVLNLVRAYFRNKKNKKSLDISIEMVGDINKRIKMQDDTLLLSKYFSPEESLLNKEKMKYYKSALVRLLKEHPSYYQVIYCRCFIGLSSASTAEYIGCSVEDVYRNLNRGLNKIKEFILELENVILSNKNVKK
jgi:RNA polymerase sigma factor (sigma-70 family)